jgi:hypothetical protein
MGHLVAVAPLLAKFAWDPQIRGIVIVAVAVAILMGSVYLLLGTNVGARLGFLLAVAGLSGWCTILGVLWSLNAGGLVGRPPTWKPVEIAIGPPGSAITPLADGLPATDKGTPTKGWRALPAGNPILGDATAAADKILAPDNTPAPEGQTKKPPKFTPPYSASSAYVQVASFEKGGRDTGVWFRIKNHRFFKKGPWYNPAGWFRAPPHMVAITVQKVAPKLNATDLTEKSRPDLSAQQTTLVLRRDRGSLRFPPVLFAIFWLTVFVVTCWSLHQRDKELMAKRAGARRPATA